MPFHGNSNKHSHQDPPRLQLLLQSPAADISVNSPKKQSSSKSVTSKHAQEQQQKQADDSNNIDGLQKTKKSVSFPSNHEHLHVIVCLIETREELDLEDLYFTRTDYHSSRTAAKLTSREAERCGYSKNLNETFDAQKSAEIQDKLNLWCVHGHSRRGLERWANSKHGEERQADQFQATMAVLRAQDDMLCSGKRRVDLEKLRRVSHKATKTSRQFARMMGKADSYAMAQQLQQEQLDESGCSISGLDDESVASRRASAEHATDALNKNDDVVSTASSSIVDIISMPGGELKDTMHGNERTIGSSQHGMSQRFKRFGFGRGNKKVEERVSRVA
ncbi:hypothetical protein MPSEU_000915000 [Mayamaea pseudoterrestris]|nr:hypothetical protein MPSEU_000915000 [Mayamaea pseudoterrestris]